jgi:hypothetical protein
VRGEGLTLEGGSAVKGGWDRGSARRGGTRGRSSVGARGGERADARA